MFATQEKSIQITAPLTEAQEFILSEEALRFLSKLARTFEPRRRQLLADRRSASRKSTAEPCRSFLPSTADIRNSDWQVAPIPADLLDRRVEITGPVDRKMIINALNSGANVFMADFEDSNSPTWSNVIQGQVNLRDAVRGDHHLHQPRRKALRTLRDPGRPDGPPARLAPGGKALSGRWRAHLGLALRFRPLLLPQRQDT